MIIEKLSRAALSCGALLLAFAGTFHYATATPNPDYVNAAWVVQPERLLKISTDSSDILLDIDVEHMRSLAIDEQRGRVWTCADSQLQVFDFSGTLLLEAPIPPSSSQAGCGDDQTSSLVVRHQDGSIWLGVKDRLLHLSLQGELLASIAFEDAITKLVLDEQRSRLWVATKKTLVAYNEAIEPVQSIALAHSDEVEDISLDAGSQKLWVAVKDELRRYELEVGTLELQQELKKIAHIASSGGGGVWAATDKELFRFDAFGVSQFPPKPFSGDDEVRDLMPDSAHLSVWLMHNKRLTQVSAQGAALNRLDFKQPLRALAVFTDQHPPLLQLTEPASGSYLDDNLPVLAFSHSDGGIGVDPLSLTVSRLGEDSSALPFALACEHTQNASACVPVNALTDGYYGLIATIRDYAGNPSPPATASFTVDTVAPAITVNSPEPNLVTAQTELTVTGVVSEAATLTINGQDVALDADYRFNHPLALASGENRIMVSATDRAGNVTQVDRTVTVQQSSTVPNPADVATPIDPTVATVLATATEFLYTGSNPIQKDVAPGTIEPKRAAVLRGQVTGRDNSPLSGVTVTILGQPAYGYTQTRNDGLFDLAVNGGGVVTINYQKPGYLPVQRQVNAPWQDYAWADPVVMIPLDPQVTAINLAAQTEIAVAQGSAQSDADGTRQATLLFSPGTQATMTLPDGSTQTLGTIHVRATEYTVGDAGPATMPGPLPPTSGYTYAVELSVDEAITAGAQTVTFSQPVYNYVENFLGFPVGGIVPTGYYDRSKAAWIPSPNGRVIKILSIDNGLAAIDGNGDGVADSDAELVALKVSADERAKLAGLYPAGQSLWRVPITHFTPWDHNWPYGPPADAEAPEQPEPKTDEKEDDPCLESGSIIECENQALRERLPVADTPFTLNYSSARISGRKSAYTLHIPISGTRVPSNLLRVQLEIAIGGRQFTHSLPAEPNQSYSFTWDGKDVYGRMLTGQQLATIRIGYVYRAIYQEPATFEQSFAAFSGVPLQGNSARQEITIWQTQKTLLGTFDALGQGLGGWQLDIQHSYDASAEVISLGTGGQRQAKSVGSVVETMAGSGRFSCIGQPPANQSIWFPSAIAAAPDGSVFFADYCDFAHRIRKVTPDGGVTVVAGTSTIGGGHDGGDGDLATDVTLQGPEGIAIAPDGSLYIADSGNYRVLRIRTDGIITTVAGKGIHGYSGDGGLATEATIDWVSGLAVAADGSLYISDTRNKRIRRIGSDGIITTVAGNGTIGYSGDGGPATKAAISPPGGIAIDINGNLYIADKSNVRVRRIGVDGIITTIAGNGTNAHSGDGGIATEAALQRLGQVAVAADGSLYLISGDRVRRVGPDGIITTVAGNGNRQYSGDGVAATGTGLDPEAIAVAADGSLYIADNNDRILRVGRTLPDIDSGEVIIPSDDGSELYHFNMEGRHLRTLDALTGAARYTFAYTGTGLLSTITDGDNNITRIERDPAGTPKAIIAPDGQRTTLTLNSNGYLATVTNPANETTRMDYSQDGLLTRFTDANNHSSVIEYDELGRLKKDSNAAEGSWSLNRNELDNGYVVSLTSALDRIKSHHVERLSTGDLKRTNTSPTGAISITLKQTNGTTVTTADDGMVVTQVEGPDPRFGMQAPIVKSLSVKTPAGLTSTVDSSRVAALANSDNPLSLQTLTDTVTVNGRTAKQTYAASTRTLTSLSPAGRTSSSTFDAQGRPLSQQVPGLATVNYAYDERGRLKQISQGAGTEQRTFSLNYDAEGNTDAITDALNRTQHITRDPVGRPKTITTSDERMIAFDYDKVGNVTALTPPERPAHGFAYTPVNLESDYTPPGVEGVAASSSGYHYNPDKQLTGIVRADGQSIVFDYEANGRLKQIVAHGGPTAAAVQTDYTYVGNTGRIESIRTAPGVGLGYTYDGSLLLNETTSGPIAGTIGRGYDNDFRITGLSLDGSVITFGYDADNLLTKAGDLTLGRDAQNGLLTGTTLGTLLTTQGYNGFGELTAFNAAHGGSGLYQASYRRDNAGRIIEKTETIGAQTDVYTYAYDAAGRLWQVHRNGVLWSEYRFDANGNRLSRTTPTGTIAGQYDAQDRLLGYGSASYTYSAHGELTGKTEGAQRTGYQYDVLGNLRQVSLPGGTAIEYVIDGRNRRIGKKVNGALVQGLLYQDQLKPIAELDGNGAVVSRFVYATRVNVPDYLIKGGVTYRIIADQLGSPRLVVNTSTGEIVQRMDFDEFGNVLTDSNPGFQPFGFAGGLYDRVTGLTRFGARDYDPEIGRWTAKDPLGFAGKDSNFYAYAGGNSVNWIDPTGLEKVNLFNPNAPAGSTEQLLYQNANKYADEKGVWHVQSHGYYLGIQDQRDGGNIKLNRPNQIADLLKEYGWKPGDPVVFHGCNTGQGDNNIAEWFQDTYGGRVSAPTNFTWSDGNPLEFGPTKIYGKNPADSSGMTPDLNAPGFMKTWNP